MAGDRLERFRVEARHDRGPGQQFAALDDPCAGKQMKRSRKVAPGRICNVTALLLCPPAPLLSASIRRAVMPGGTSYSWTTSHGTVVIRPSFSGQCQPL
jgi:hypothetical protein